MSFRIYRLANKGAERSGMERTFALIINPSDVAHEDAANRS